MFDDRLFFVKALNAKLHYQILTDVRTNFLCPYEPLAGNTFVSYNPEMLSGDELLKLSGHALYGERWQTSLSRDLGVTDRTIRNWANGSVECPSDLAERLVPVLRSRGTALLDLIALAERLQTR